MSGGGTSTPWLSVGPSRPLPSLSQFPQVSPWCLRRKEKSRCVGSVPREGHRGPSSRNS